MSQVVSSEVFQGTHPRLKLKTFLEFSKSGIVTLVLISVSAGFLMGHPHELSLSVSKLFWTLFGILLLASGSSALNQYQERFIDEQMNRTSKRPLPSGRLSPSQALTFIALSVSVGLFILAAFVSLSVFGLGLCALISYNGLYTLWWKKHWAHAAIPGAIPGALPILMGYAAASGQVFTAEGIYLFLILFYWQMPHFWVLAIKYKDDYASGKIPTLPVAKGEDLTRKEIAIWSLGFVGLSLLAPLFLKAGPWYFVLSIPMSAKVISEMISYLRDPGPKAWLRFFLWINFSLIGYLGAAVIDRWALHLLTPWWVR